MKKMWTKCAFLRSYLLGNVCIAFLVISFSCHVRCDQHFGHFGSMSCTLNVNSWVYDLSPMIKKDTNFVAQIATFDRRSYNSHFLTEEIQLNVCGALTNTSDNWCSINHPNSAVCVKNRDDNSTQSIGDFNNETSLTYNHETGSIELVYYANHSISNISLFCREGVYESHPILLRRRRNKQNVTVFNFEWGISYACPVTITKGADCVIRDEHGEVTYDLTSLRKPHFYSVNHSNEMYYINICGAIESVMCNGYGACQVIEKNAISLGIPSSDLIYESGTLKLYYANGKPLNGKELQKRKTVISFICVKDEGKTDYNPIFVSESNGIYSFKFETPAACRLKPPISSCVFENDTHRVDLSKLTLYGKQSHFAVGGRGFFVINVCRPISPYLSLGESECSPTAGVCKVDITDHHNALNFGQPKDPPFIYGDGSIALRYVNGDPCPQNKSKRLESVIKFICSEEESDFVPTFVAREKSCEAVFEWKTLFACGVVEMQAEENCTFRDNRTGLGVDLSILTKNDNFNHVVHDYHIYNINICGNPNYISDKKCKGSAVCMKIVDAADPNIVTFVHLGSISQRKMNYDGSQLIVTYSNGSECGVDDTYSVRFRFKCDPNANKGKLVMDSIAKCVATFDWETNVVCELDAHKHDCTLLTNDHFYDLRVLSTASHVWHVNGTNDDSYLLNICHSLPRNLNCGNSKSAVCMCRNNSGCTHSLGDYSTAKLSMSNDGKLILSYSGGSSIRCPLNATTQVKFKCGNRRGSPQFVELKDCSYIFEWTTFAACPVNENGAITLEEKDGYVYDKTFDRTFNMTPYFERSFEAKGFNHHTKDYYSYRINLVNITFPNDKRCYNASVCQMKPDKLGQLKFTRNIGSHRNYKFELLGDQVRLVFTSSDEQKCGKNSLKNVTTIFVLGCSHAEDLSEPKFIYESNDCDYIFEWNSKYLCFNYVLDGGYFVPQPVSTTPGSAGSDSPRFSPLALVMVVFLLFICLAFVVTLLINQERRTNIARRIRRVFGPQVTPSFQYSQLSTNDLLANAHHPEVSFITSGCSSFSPYSDTTTAKDMPVTGHQTVPYSIYDDSDVNLLT